MSIELYDVLIAGRYSNHQLPSVPAQLPKHLEEE